MLATQLEELAQKRAAAIQAAIRAQAQPNITCPVVEKEVATQLAEFADRQKNVDDARPTPPAPVEGQKDTMYHLYERAVMESYKSSPDTEAGGGASSGLMSATDVPVRIQQNKSEIENSIGTTDGQLKYKPTTQETEMLSARNSKDPREHSDRSTDFMSRSMVQKDIGQYSMPCSNTIGKNETEPIEQEPVKLSGNSSELKHTAENYIKENNSELIDKDVSENLDDVSSKEIAIKVFEGKPAAEEQRELVDRNETSVQSESKSSNEGTNKNVKLADTSSGNQVLNQNISRPAYILENSPVQQEHVLHDSEMSDVSDRTSISPGLNVTTPETERLTPEHNMPPIEN